LEEIVDNLSNIEIVDYGNPNLVRNCEYCTNATQMLTGTVIHTPKSAEWHSTWRMRLKRATNWTTNYYSCTKFEVRKFFPSNIQRNHKLNYCN